MEKLQQAFQRAERWVKRSARPLEAARWDYAFNGGSRARVLDILAAFQNEDGGFGNALEPDYWLPSSSSIAIWTACTILLEVEADADHPLVRSVVNYLCCSQEPTGIWTTVLPENNDYPHAPWWHWEPGVQETWMFNPSVALAAYLIHWSEPGSRTAEQAWMTVRLALERLMDCSKMDMHELSLFLKLKELMEQRNAEFETQTNYRLAEVGAKVKELVGVELETDPSKWMEGYFALPLTFIQSPDSYLYPDYKELVEENLRVFAEQVDEDGLWPVAWGWGAYPEEFAVAKRYWQGIIALERYRIFKAFGWLE